MKISELMIELSKIKDISGDISVWVEVDYHVYDDNASKSGPVIYKPYTRILKNKRGLVVKNEPIVVIWGDC